MWGAASELLCSCTGAVSGGFCPSGNLRDSLSSFAQLTTAHVHSTVSLLFLSAPLLLSCLIQCSFLLFPVLVQITTELYEADLEKALILSKLEFEQQKQVNESVIVFVVNNHHIDKSCPTRSFDAF